MIKLTFIATLMTIFLVSCQGTVATVEGRNDLLHSGISICGGGIDTGVTATIEAEYEKQKGNIDSGFKQYVRAVLDANGASEQKYEKYIDCVLQVDERERQTRDRALCQSSCDRIKNQCISDKKSDYDQCIRAGHASCLIQCKTIYRLSKSECHENCNPNKSYNIGVWERNHGCKSANNYLCNADYQECIENCN